MHPLSSAAYQASMGYPGMDAGKPNLTYYEDSNIKKVTSTFLAQDRKTKRQKDRKKEPQKDKRQKDNKTERQNDRKTKGEKQERQKDKA